MSDYIAIAIAIMIVALLGTALFLGKDKSTVQGAITNTIDKGADSINNLDIKTTP